ncbi:putative agamous-like MADS-box protein AGL31-like [Capsicum annuum]|nr:putative agamous-like MADS-box protein AGL31-like [Capsicum annuum]
MSQLMVKYSTLPLTVPLNFVVIQNSDFLHFTSFVLVIYHDLVDKWPGDINLQLQAAGIVRASVDLSIIMDIPIEETNWHRASHSKKCHLRSWVLMLELSLTGILQRYKSHVEAEKEISAEIQVAESKYSRFMPMGELLQETDRQLEETNADDFTVSDLIHLENELQTALIQTRSRKVFISIGTTLHRTVDDNFMRFDHANPNAAASRGAFVINSSMLLESVKRLHEKIGLIVLG